MNLVFLKRRYYDFRVGGGAIGPLIQMASFVGIVFLYVDDILPIEVFAPVFIVSGFLALVIIGNRFRDIQVNTDNNMNFEKSSLQASILYQILLTQKEIMVNLNLPIDRKFDDILTVIKNIADDKDLKKTHEIINKENR